MSSLSIKQIMFAVFLALPCPLVPVCLSRNAHKLSLLASNLELQILTLSPWEEASTMGSTYVKDKRRAHYVQLWTHLHCLSHLGNFFIWKNGQPAGAMVTSPSDSV